MTLLDNSYWPDVRAALDVKLDAAMLPDSVIEMDIHSGAAAREVIARVPDAESKTGDDEKRVKAAAVYLTAARMVYAVAQITSISVQTRDTSYSRRAWDPEAKKTELLALAEDELAVVIEPGATTPGRPTMFAAAAGGRGR